MAGDLTWKSWWPGLLAGGITGGLGHLVAGLLGVEDLLPRLAVFVLTGVVVGVLLGLVFRWQARRSDSPPA